MFDEYYGSPELGFYQVGPRVVCVRHGEIEDIDVAFPPETADFWGVYKQRLDGLWCWIADFKEKASATEFVYEVMEARRCGGATAESMLIERYHAQSMFPSLPSPSEFL